jgi:hypothetical protein
MPHWSNIAIRARLRRLTSDFASKRLGCGNEGCHKHRVGLALRNFSGCDCRVRNLPHWARTEMAYLRNHFDVGWICFLPGKPRIMTKPPGLRMAIPF